jgi:hypothetical protein
MLLLYVTKGTAVSKLRILFERKTLRHCMALLQVALSTIPPHKLFLHATLVLPVLDI